MTMPQLMAKYKGLALKIARMDKKLDKQFNKIIEILDDLAKGGSYKQNFKNYKI